MKPGDTFRHPYLVAPSTKCHVRGVVDNRLVCRYWRPKKQRWEYIVFERWEVDEFVRPETILKANETT